MYPIAARRLRACIDDNVRTAYANGIRPGAEIAEQSIFALQSALAHGRTTSAQITLECLLRISRCELDPSGPHLGAVIAVNPRAMDMALRRDRERAAHGPRGPLDGIPLLVKDLIDVNRCATTAGALPLLDNFVDHDDVTVRRLRAAGAIILGKTNPAEWAGRLRSAYRPGQYVGWSAVGGRTKNPYAFDHTAESSSGGSAAAVAVSLAPLTLATDATGSVIYPAAANGLVGLRPTTRLVRTDHAVPTFPSLDTVGAMGRTVADVAAMWEVLAGMQPGIGASEGDGGLRGARLGVWRLRPERVTGVDAVFDESLVALRAAGATTIELDPAGFTGVDETDAFARVFFAEAQRDLNRYLSATSPQRVLTRTMADVVAFNRIVPDEMLSELGQDGLEAVRDSKGTRDRAYLNAKGALRANAERFAAYAAEHHLDGLVSPSAGPAIHVDHVDERILGYTTVAALAGHPVLTVPMGDDGGMPIGLSFTGRPNSERALLRMGAEFEAATHARVPPHYFPERLCDSLRQ